MANIIINSRIKSSENDVVIQGGLKTDKEIEAVFNEFINKRNFNAPKYIIYKIKQDYWRASMGNRPNDILVEAVR